MEGPASFYRWHIAPRLLHWCCGTRLVADLRRQVCEGLVGEVIEIGFGSGSNVPYYPPSVTQVSAVEPSDVAWQLAQKRVAGCPVPVRRAGRDGQRLPFPDHTFDAALST